jgi:hypothetical protein
LDARGFKRERKYDIHSNNNWEKREGLKITFLLHFLNFFNQDRNDTGIGQSRDITERVLLSVHDLAENTTHNLARTCLRKVDSNIDTLRCCEWADDSTDL